MFFFHKIPLFRILLALLAGILAGIYGGDLITRFPVLPVFCLLTFLAAFVVLLILKKGSTQRKKAFGVTLNGVVFLLGLLITLIRTDHYYPDHISSHDNSAGPFLVKALNDISEKPKSYKVEAEVLTDYHAGHAEHTSGRVILYLEKDSVSAGIQYGDVFLVHAPLRFVQGPQNPGQFNYRRYLQFRQVSREAYVPSHALRLTGINEGNAVKWWSSRLRARLLDILRLHGLEGPEFAVGAALILGYTAELDPEIMSQYAGSGALHVLSVSGLHVGILYLVLVFSLSFLDKLKHGNIIKAILLLFFLAFYATITGLSPSVLRATVMFGFIAMAKAVNRHTSIYNILAASAVFLLVIDPYLIMQAGFQLSYLAVLGIVAVHPLLAAKWEPKTKISKWIWDVTCVSIAAQLVTAPLSVLYFHQFPVYFIFSNMVVIPLAALILYVGLAALMSAFLPPLCDLLVYVLKELIVFLNASVKTTEALPYSTLNGLDITFFEMVLFYLVIISLFVLVTRKNIKGLYVGLAALLIISFTQFWEGVQQSSQQKLIIYHVPGAAAYEVVKGRQNSLYASAALLNDKNKMHFNIEQCWWENGVENQELYPIDSMQAPSGIIFLPAGNKNVVVINDDFDNAGRFSGKLKTDYVILGKNAGITIEQVKKYFSPGLVIFDSSVSRKKSEKWGEECKANALKYYSVSARGAFVAEL